jgi:hypothetical protein
MATLSAINNCRLPLRCQTGDEGQYAADDGPFYSYRHPYLPIVILGNSTAHPENRKTA